MDTGELKAIVTSEIESRRPQLDELSHRIHSDPETAFQEFRAAALLSDYLEANGFSVERGICDMPTAFRADSGKGKPVIALLAEYDALPGVGHGCGHNLIAASAVGAAMGARLAAQRLGGRIAVIGTPAEEGQGGKALMATRGAFDDVDAAMLTHPSGEDTAVVCTLACHTLEVEFTGRAARAAANPEEGINALEAMIQSFNAINSLRQYIRGEARIHGIITRGGDASNVVPAHTAGSFIVRAGDDAYLDDLETRVINCFTGAALATGTRLDYQWSEARYAAMLPNLTLARLYRENMASLGRRMHLGDSRLRSFSTDVGNVSQRLPAIHPMISIAPPTVSMHTPEFGEAAASDAGRRGLFDAARAMAMTAVDILAEPALMARVRDEFERQKGHGR